MVSFLVIDLTQCTSIYSRLSRCSTAMGSSNGSVPLRLRLVSLFIEGSLKVENKEQEDQEQG